MNVIIIRGTEKRLLEIVRILDKNFIDFDVEEDPDKEEK